MHEFSCQPLSHAEARRFRQHDPAWMEHGHKGTNYQLGDGDRVVLLSQTLGDAHRSQVIVPAGITGTVVRARTPRVYEGRAGESVYFANVDIETPDWGSVRVRVPHAALKRCGRTDNQFSRSRRTKRSCRSRRRATVQKENPHDG